MSLQLRNSGEGYGWVAILLHWSIALVFLCQLALGLAMSRIADQRSAFELIQLHKSLGFLILGLAVLRLAWRFSSVRPASPAGMSSLEKGAAHAVHALLYALQFALPLTGWALVSASVLAIPTMPFGLLVIPNLPVGSTEAAEMLWSTVHAWLAYAAIGVVALHAAAALHHHVVRRDAVLARMLAPPRPHIAGAAEEGARSRR